YRMHGTDLAAEPLEFAMNNQHMNGGILIDDWGRTSLQGCYAIGEAAGSHGVTRPGGAALNSGQVFGKRVAEAIKRSHLNRAAFEPSAEVVNKQVEATLNDAHAFLNASDARKPKEIKTEVQARMSDYAGIICTQEDVASALEAAKALRSEIESRGIQISTPSLVGQAFRWRHMVYVSEAVLTALDHYIQNGGGSRGARAICTDAGTRCPDAHGEDLSRFRFIEEQQKDREEKLVVSRTEDGFSIHTLPVNLSPEVDRQFFEKGWGAYLIKEG
ncbi:MAG: FAD-binding protein, partial [Puniceicoccaceae bacterium]|nr:FAD-binding protein [Puniceicoccaceae bacterium]